MGRAKNTNEVSASIFEILTLEHRDVAALFEQIEAMCEVEPTEAKDLFIVLRDNLLAHAKSENEQLRRELRDARANANANLANARLAESLKKLLQFEGGSTYPKDYRAVNTTVISYPSSSGGV